MLRIHTVTSASSAARYYAASDYYSEGQETVGRWGGKLAERLGLAGTVDQMSFERLCDNLNPATGQPLTPRTNAERRVGYDFTFSACKSFSVLEALAPEAERKRLLAAFDEAVTETMERDVEPDMLTRDRKEGADFNRPTGNLLWAGFDHSTARPVGDAVPDMHRHRHVLVFNATFDPEEGRIKAGQFGSIKADGEYYTACFYARLAAKLEALGYGIERKGGRAWEITGVPQAVIDRFSKRTGEVEEEHAERLETDPDYRPEYKHELGAKTRGQKQKELTPAELRRAWDAQLSPQEREALEAVACHAIPGGQAVTPAAAVGYAIAHLSEQRAVWAERELKRVALLHGLGGVTPERIAAELPRQGVLTREIDGRRWATTEALQREEERIVGFAAQGRGAVCPVGVAEGLERGALNEGQWQAVTRLLESSNRVELVEGPAGAGKSWLLQKFDEGMRLAGERATYLASTSDAAGVLSKDGFEAHTVARFLVDEAMQREAQGGRVVIDEASMLGHADALRLVQLAERLDLKLIFVGDAMQHGSVPRGALLHVLKEYAGIRPFQLTEIKRQEDAEYRAAATLLSQGETLAGFDLLGQKGWIREIASDAERAQAIAAEYRQAVEEKKSVLVVSPTHREAAQITAAIRSELRAAGRLGEEERTFTRLVAANATEAERGQVSTYRPGDVLVFHQNGKGFTKGERLTVSDPSQVPTSEAAKFQLYRPEAIALAAGDRIRFTGTVRTRDGKHKLSNGQARTVAGWTKAGDIRLDNGWVVSGDAGMFRHGFVETSFGSQGKTVQRAIVAASSASLPAVNREMAYVSGTRARERMSFYTDDTAAVREALQRSSHQPAALDLKPKPKASAWERLRRLLSRRRRQTAHSRQRAAWPAAERQPERQVSHGR